jgi:hypothetical protein
LIFAWSDSSGFRERFGFKFGLHVIEYPAFLGTLEAGRKLARERRPPTSHNSVDRGVAFGSEPGIWIPGGARGVVPNLLVPSLRVHPAPGPGPRRSPGPDSGLFPAFDLSI